MNDMENLRTFADQLWKYMVPKLNAMFASNVSYFRAQVMSNPGNNMLEVQRPLENGTLTLPCVDSVAHAQPGQQVVALVMGSMSNAIVVGDGKLNSPSFTLGPDSMVTFEAGAGNVPVLSCRTSSISTIYRSGINLCPRFADYSTGGVTYTVNDDGSITVTGTTTASSSIVAMVPLPPGTYCVSGAPDDSRGANGTLDIYVIVNGAIAAQDYNGVPAATKTFTVTSATVVNIICRVSSTSGFSSNGAVFYPQIDVGDTPTQYATPMVKSWNYNPGTDTLVPTVMSSVQGVNHIWSDTGDVTVEYGSFVQAMQKEIESLN